MVSESRIGEPMNEDTKHILREMLAVLTAYEQETASLRYLVDELEDSLNVLKEKLPKAFYDQWHVHWGVLKQIADADAPDERNVVYIEESVEALKASISQLVDEL